MSHDDVLVGFRLRLFVAGEIGVGPAATGSNSSPWMVPRKGTNTLPGRCYRSAYAGQFPGRIGVLPLIAAQRAPYWSLTSTPFTGS